MKNPINEHLERQLMKDRIYYRRLGIIMMLTTFILGLVLGWILTYLYMKGGYPCL